MTDSFARQKLPAIFTKAPRRRAGAKAFLMASQPEFQLLQNSGSTVPPIYFYAFDLLNRDGEDLLRSTIEQRCRLLKELLPTPTDPMRLSPLLQPPVGQIFEAVQKLGFEGIVGKRCGSLYEPGERSGAWIKRRMAFRDRWINRLHACCSAPAEKNYNEGRPSSRVPRSRHPERNLQGP